MTVLGEGNRGDTNLLLDFLAGVETTPVDNLVTASAQLKRRRGGSSLAIVTGRFTPGDAAILCARPTALRQERAGADGDWRGHSGSARKCGDRWRDRSSVRRVMAAIYHAVKRLPLSHLGLVAVLAATVGFTFHRPFETGALVAVVIGGSDPTGACGGITSEMAARAFDLIRGRCGRLLCLCRHRALPERNAGRDPNTGEHQRRRRRAHQRLGTTVIHHSSRWPHRNTSCNRCCDGLVHICHRYRSCTANHIRARAHCGWRRRCRRSRDVRHWRPGIKCLVDHSLHLHDGVPCSAAPMAPQQARWTAKRALGHGS